MTLLQGLFQLEIFSTSRDFSWIRTQRAALAGQYFQPKLNANHFQSRIICAVIWLGIPDPVFLSLFSVIFAHHLVDQTTVYSSIKFHLRMHPSRPQPAVAVCSCKPNRNRDELRLEQFKFAAALFFFFFFSRASRPSPPFLHGTSVNGVSGNKSNTNYATIGAWSRLSAEWAKMAAIRP